MKVINDLAARYIEYKENEAESSPKTIIRYKYLLDVYVKFLCTQYIDEATLIPILNTAKCNHLFDALSDYIVKHKIKSEDTCDLYVSVIKGFLIYLNDAKNIISNDDLIKSFNPNMPDHLTFLKQYRNFKEGLKSKKTIKYASTTEPLEELAIKKLINHCRDHFEKNVIKATKGRWWYHAIMNTVMVRLVARYGISQRTIAGLDLQNYHADTKTLFVNKIEILLGEELNFALSEYIKARKKNVPDSSLLFVRWDGSTVENMMGSYLSNVLKIGDKEGSVIAVSKYAILRMLENNIGSGFIGRLTDYEEQVLAPCIELFEIGRENDYLEVLTKMAD